MSEDDISFIKDLEKSCIDYYWQAIADGENNSASRFAVIALCLARLRGYDGD